MNRAGTQRSSGVAHGERQRISDTAWVSALSVAERLKILRACTEPPSYDADVSERWIDRLRVRDEGSTVGRLRSTVLHGCTEEELRTILGQSPASIEAPVPEWALDVDAALQRSSGDDVETLPELGDRMFVSATGPLIARALDRIRIFAEQCASMHAYAPFRADAVGNALLGAIAGQLQILATPSAVLEMHAARMNGRLTSSSSSGRYHEFSSLLRTGTTNRVFFEQYPVLARLTVTLLSNWIVASSEFLFRLAHDTAELADLFGLSLGVDRLIAFEPLGDPHCGGRRVAVCTFDSGLRVIYKPRPVGNEFKFQGFLSWISERSSLPPFRPLTIKDCGTHGWVEFVEPAPCKTVGELRQFYCRLGAHLAALDVLGGGDFHYENILGAGAHPFVVDLESVLQPSIVVDEGDTLDIERVAYEDGPGSILRMGLLPSRIFTSDEDDGVDVSGIGAVADQRTPMRVPHWLNEGTDAMRQGLSRVGIGTVHSHPIPSAFALTVGDFIEDIREGFEIAYRAILRHRDELDMKGSPIDAFRQESGRCILRPTVTYAMLLRSSYHPHLLTDGVSRDLHFDHLLGSVPSWWKSHGAAIAAAERVDLWNLDIPRFGTRPNSRDVWLSTNERIRNFFPSTGMERAKRRLQRMSASEYEIEAWLIRNSIATAELTAAHGRPNGRRVNLARERIRADGDVLAAASAIGERLSQLAVTHHDSATWFGVKTSTRAERWSVSLIGPDLYEGLAGTTLFLAYLGSVVENPRYVALARAALTTLRAQRGSGAYGDSIGAFSGLAGYLYALVNLGLLFDDDALLREADSLVTEIAELTDSTTEFDVISGLAGCISVLLALHRVRPAEEVIAVARRCGVGLLASATKTPEGLGWIVPEISRRPLGGFAHGTAGASLALLELAEATDDDCFRDAATEAIRYERSLYSRQAGAWLDVRENYGPYDADPPSEGRYPALWCHGAAGIGLARLRSLKYTDDPLMIDEVRTAIETTIAQGFGSNHSLCHGDLGNIELVTHAAQSEFADPAWKAAVERLSVQILTDLEDHGCVSGHPFGLETPGLMVGIAGIGYGLLRLAEPHVPSILLLDTPTL